MPGSTKTWSLAAEALQLRGCDGSVQEWMYLPSHCTYIPHPGYILYVVERSGVTSSCAQVADFVILSLLKEEYNFPQVLSLLRVR